MAKKRTQGRPVYGMPTNPGKDILKEIKIAKRLSFDYVELYMESPQGHYDILRNKSTDILRLLKKFRHGPVSHTAYWYELWSD